MKSPGIKLAAIYCLSGCALVAACLGTARILHFKNIFNWHIRPTYHADRVATDLARLCQKEYKLRVETRRVGNALQASFWKVGVFKPGEQQEMRPEAAESLEGVLLCATRISLSTNAPLEFLEVKMADVLTGASVTIWRFVPDIRDSMYDRMAEDEYINRLLIDVNKKESGDKREWSELTWDPPLTMAEFLAKQVVHRAQREIREKEIDLQAHEDLSKPDTLVVVVDNWPTDEKKASKQKEKVADLFEKTARKVVQGYQFKGFHEFILQDGQGTALGRWPL